MRHKNLIATNQTYMVERRDRQFVGRGEVWRKMPGRQEPAMGSLSMPREKAMAGTASLPRCTKKTEGGLGGKKKHAME